jgi:hypothetical protein
VWGVCRGTDRERCAKRCRAPCEDFFLVVVGGGDIAELLLMGLAASRLEALGGSQRYAGWRTRGDASCGGYWV